MPYSGVHEKMFLISTLMFSWPLQNQPTVDNLLFQVHEVTCLALNCFGLPKVSLPRKLGGFVLLNYRFFNPLSRDHRSFLPIP